MPPKIGVWASSMHKIEPYVDELFVTWEISIKCNYDCSYCGDVSDLNGEVLSHSRYLEIADHIHRLTSFHTNVHLNITGGEPTQIPDLIGLCKHLKQLNPSMTININSNGSKGVLYYHELSQWVDTFDLSAHFEWIKTKAFIKKMAKLRRLVGKKLCIHIMAEPQAWDDFVLMSQAFQRWGFQTSELRIRQATYTPEQDAYLQRNSRSSLAPDVIVDGVAENSLDLKNRMLRAGLQKHENYFEGWMCSATSTSLFIKADHLWGGVCWNHDYGTIDHVQHLIKEKICSPVKRCMCNSDLRARKERL